MAEVWLDPRVQFALFAVLYFVFLTVATSVLLGIRDNYRRYYQKAELQWTGPASRFRSRSGRLRPLWILAVSLLAAWITVTFVI